MQHIQEAQGEFEKGRANGFFKITFKPAATYPFASYQGSVQDGHLHDDKALCIDKQTGQCVSLSFQCGRQL